MRHGLYRLSPRFFLLFLAACCVFAAALPVVEAPVKGQAVKRNGAHGTSGERQSITSLLVPNGMAVVTSTADDGPTLRVVDISQFGPLWTNPANYAPNYIAATGQMPLLQSWTPSQFNDSLGNQSMRGLAVSADGTRIYVGTSGYVGPNKTPNIYRIGPASSTPLLMSTLPSYVADVAQRRGIGGLDLDETHHSVFASSYADGIIYRVDATTPGPPVGSFDPLTPYVPGTTTLPPPGERVIAIAYHKLENRLYYSIWGGGSGNTMRSVGLTAAGGFNPASDRLEFIAGGAGPVLDMEFNDAGNRMLLAEEDIIETGGIVTLDAHTARGLEYIGGTTTWIPDPVIYAGTSMKYNVGEIHTYRNCRGGAAWAYASITGTGVISGNETFVMFTGDALRFDLPNTVLVYGLQFIPAAGGAAAGSGGISNSLIADLNYDITTTDKYIYGDVDIRRTLNPNAAEVSITGRVLTSSGSGITKASVILTNVRGESRSALTNPFGYYKFEGLRAGETVTLTAAAKGRQFTTRIITVDDDLADVNFIAIE